MQLLRAALLLVGAPALLACGQAPSEACRAFVACAADYAEQLDVSPPETGRYDEGGSCWRDPAIAEACTEQCLDTAAAYEQTLEDAGLPPGECAGAKERRADAQEDQGA